MPFEWLNDFQRTMEKADDYADKTLAAYRLGIKAGGSIRGVSVCVSENCCGAAKLLPEGTVSSRRSAALAAAGLLSGR